MLRLIPNGLQPQEICDSTWFYTFCSAFKLTCFAVCDQKALQCVLGSIVGLCIVQHFASSSMSWTLWSKTSQSSNSFKASQSALFRALRLCPWNVSRAESPVNVIHFLVINHRMMQCSTACFFKTKIYGLVQYYCLLDKICAARAPQTFYTTVLFCFFNFAVVETNWMK